MTFQCEVPTDDHTTRPPPPRPAPPCPPAAPEPTHWRRVARRSTASPGSVWSGAPGSSSPSFTWSASPSTAGSWSRRASCSTPGAAASGLADPAGRRPPVGQPRHRRPARSDRVHDELAIVAPATIIVPPSRNTGHSVAPRHSIDRSTAAHPRRGQLSPHRRVDAVGADQHVAVDHNAGGPGAVDEARTHSAIVPFDADEPVIDVHHLSSGAPAQRVVEDALQMAAVDREPREWPTGVDAARVVQDRLASQADRRRGTEDSRRRDSRAAVGGPADDRRNQPSRRPSRRATAAHRRNRRIPALHRPQPARSRPRAAAAQSSRLTTSAQRQSSGAAPAAHPRFFGRFGVIRDTQNRLRTVSSVPWRDGRRGHDAAGARAPRGVADQRQPLDRRAAFVHRPVRARSPAVRAAGGPAGRDGRAGRRRAVRQHVRPGDRDRRAAGAGARRRRGPPRRRGSASTIPGRTATA